MNGIVEDKVVIVTGAGRGIGRGHALEFARQGAKVVVNDLGAEVDGTGSSSGPAGEVVNEIRANGGEAIANGDDVSDFAGAERLISAAIERFGDLHVLVNNAGILRDRMLTNMSIDEWDAVIKVHLRGTFGPLHFAAAYWRDRSKSGATTYGRVVNTTSASGIYGNVGQVNYGAAKAGIASMTIIASQELARYGVTVNAVAPGALTRMAQGLPDAESLGGALRPGSPDDIAPLVVWLASPEASEITGRVFNIMGGNLSVAEGWHSGPGVQQEGRFDVSTLGDIVPQLVARAKPNALPTGLYPA